MSLWFLVAAVAALFAMTPVGCDGNNTEDNTPTDGGPIPESSLPDSPIVKTCGSNEKGCCLSVSLSRQWQAHEEKGTYSPNTWSNIALSNDDKWIFISDGSNSTVRVWNVSDRTFVRVFGGHKEGIRAMAHHPSKGILAVGSYDDTITLWNTADGKLLRTLTGHKGNIHSVAFSPDGSKLVSGSDDRNVMVWNTDSGKAERTIEGPKARIQQVSVSTDGQWVAGSSDDKKLYIWKLSDGSEHKVIDYSGALSVLFFKHNGTEYLAGSTSGGTVRVWEMPDATAKFTLKAKDKDKAHDRAVQALHFGKGRLISGDDNGYVRSWSMDDGSQLSDSKLHNGAVRTIALKQDDNTLISAGSDGRGQTYRISTNTKLGSIALFQELAHNVTSDGGARLYASSRTSKDVLVWDLNTRTRLPNWKGHNAALTALAYDKATNKLASASEDGNIKFWNPGEGKVIGEAKGLPAFTESMAFSPTGKWLAAAFYDGKLRVFLADGTVLKTLELGKLPLLAVAASPDGTRVAVASQNGEIYTVAASSWSLEKTLKGHTGAVHSLAFSQDSKQLLSGGGDGSARRWDPNSGKQLTSIDNAHTSIVHSILDDSANGRFFTASRDALIRVWRAKDNKMLYEFRGHNAHIHSMNYIKDKQQLFSFGLDSVIRRWDLGEIVDPVPLKAHEGKKVSTVAVSPNDLLLATGSSELNDVKIWDRQTNTLKMTLTGHKEQITDIAFGPDNKLIATASFDKTVKLWDLETGKELRTLEGNEDRVYRVRFSPDGSKIATAGGDWSIRIYETETGKQLKSYTDQHNTIVTSVAWHTSGILIASASYDKTVKLLAIDGSAEPKTLKSHSGGVSDVIFVPGGSALLSASFDQSVKEWETGGSNRVRRTYSGHKQGVTRLAVHPSGSTFATVSNDMTVKIWNRSGNVLRTITDHTATPTDLAYTSAGEVLYTASEDGTVRGWPIASPQRAAFYQRPVGASSIGWQPKGKNIAVSSINRKVSLWDSETFKKKDLYYGKGIQRIRWSRDGLLLSILASEDGVVIWRAKDSKNIRTIKPQDEDDLFQDMDFSPDGSQVVTASKDTTVRIWGTNSGKLDDILKGHDHPVTRVRFHPEGKIIASSDDKGTMKLWKVEDGNTIKSWEAHKTTINAIGFEPTGKWLVTASTDGTVKIWGGSDGTMQQELCVGGSAVAVAFDPEGKWLAVGTYSGAVKLFQTSDWKLLKTLQGPYLTVEGLAWSPDAKQLAGAFQNGQTQLWTIDP